MEKSHRVPRYPNAKLEKHIRRPQNPHPKQILTARSSHPTVGIVYQRLPNLPHAPLSRRPNSSSQKLPHCGIPPAEGNKKT
ncbi:hypothetical protein L484_021636 [Morus notabilis]|uniref:Uncharacterized protein n=1 Tax=Morus notabilis TaxID=981085 RepID=W9S5Z8_9ROSA|nr:hypothetical protein L484_021636 [Morus notabilis]